MKGKVYIKGIRARIIMLAIIIFVGSLIIVTRASGLQIKHSDKYKSIATNQHEKVIELRPKRGNISDRNGVDLAITVERFSLFARPKKFVDEKEKVLFARILAGLLKREEKELIRLFNEDKPFVWVSRLIDDVDIRKIRGASGFSKKEFERRGDLKRLSESVSEKVGIGFNYEDPLSLINDILNQRFLYKKFVNDKVTRSKMTEVGRHLYREVISFGNRTYEELTDYEKDTLRALNRYLIEITFADLAPKNPFFYTSAFGLIKENKRYYPHGKLASHILGYTNIDQEGMGGIELVLNESLKGEYQYISGIRDALGREIYTGENVRAKMAEGNRVVLTIDANIQYTVESELERGVQKYNAVGGYAVVLNPKTGEVLAMANYPMFDSNYYFKYPAKVRLNSAISSPFEPGSVTKVFTVAAALEESVVNPITLLDCENGEMKIGSHTIRDPHPHGMLSVADIIKYSSNIGAVKIGLRVGGSRLVNYLNKFGFGRFTEITLPAESRGIFPTFERWPDITVATMSFGQTIAATPLQIAAAYGAIANKGVYISPRIIDRLVDSKTGLTIKEYQSSRRERVISADNAVKVIEMMKKVTEEGGTGVRARTDGFNVAGKTGTAQKVDTITKGYSDKRIATFVGFLPAEDAQLVILVSIDEPQGEVYGGIVAAPVFSEIAKRVLKYLGIFPSTSVKENSVSKTTNESVDNKTATEVEENQILSSRYLYNDELPNLIGLSLRDALGYLRPKNITVNIVGSGRVYKQIPPPFSSIPRDRKMVLFLKRD